MQLGDSGDDPWCDDVRLGLLAAHLQDLLKDMDPRELERWASLVEAGATVGVLATLGEPLKPLEGVPLFSPALAAVRRVLAQRAVGHALVRALCWSRSLGSGGQVQ